jgi:extradiol dioxygenase family protein
MKNKITEQAIKNAKSAMNGFGLTEILIHTKPISKTRFYASAVYVRYGLETLIDYSFDFKGKQMSMKVIYHDKFKR